MTPDQLIDAYLDDEVTPSQMGQLDAWIREDAENVWLFCRKAMVHNAIDEQMRTFDVNGKSHQLNEASSRSPILHFLGDVAEGINWHMYPARFVTIVLLLTLLGWVGVYFLVRPAFFAEREVAEQAGNTRLPFVAKLDAVVDAEWVADRASTPISGLFLEQRRTLKLKSGLAKIRFRSEAYVILEGPCVFTLVGKNAGHLQSGKLSARVPEAATGFRVETPFALITDLGTEFGVEVGNSGETESHVFSGTVEVRIVSGSSKSGKNVVRLGVNESARVAFDPAGKELVINTVRASDQKPVAAFVRGMPKRTPIKLFNTGVGLKKGDTDPHWQIVAVSNDPKFKPHQAVVTYDPVWMPTNSARANWISIADNSTDLPHGVFYTFRTTFDLTGLDPKAAILDLRLAVDNHVEAIRLNGRNMSGFTHEYEAFHFLHPCKTIRHGFVAGVNVLDIQVGNGSPGSGLTASPMGILVELEGFARSQVKTPAGAENGDVPKERKKEVPTGSE